jgi:hypothetical protein
MLQTRTLRIPEKLYFHSDKKSSVKEVLLIEESNNIVPILYILFAVDI